MKARLKLKFVLEVGHIFFSGYYIYIVFRFDLKIQGCSVV